MAIGIPLNPSAFLPTLIPPPPPAALYKSLLRLQELFAPQQLVVVLQDPVHSFESGGLDEFETAHARGWLGRLVSLGTRELCKCRDDGDEWDAIVDLASILLSALSGDGGTFLLTSLLAFAKTD